MPEIDGDRRDTPESRGRAPRLFTIAPSRPFLPVLVDALFDGRLVDGFRFAPGDDPLALADVTVLVPTRRAARALRAAVVARLGGRAAILPRIAPLGDIDEDAAVIDGGGETAFARDLAREVDGLERLLGLTRLVVAWSEGVSGARPENPLTGAAPTLPASPAEAAHLARALLTLMDQVETEGSDWSRLADIVPADHADYWALTLSFLEIVARHWPAFLAERGLADPARRRNDAILAEAARLARSGSRGPIVAAGSTGSIPATAKLLAAVARLPNGAVVLPGLDLGLEPAAWDAIGGPDREDAALGHPQYGLKRLLAEIGAGRDAVVDLDPEPSPALGLRLRTLGEALKPVAATDGWRDFAPRAGGEAALDAAFAGVSLVEAQGEAEHALAIALALRETLERDDRATAALVTPDRTLARRVAAELARWGLAIDDSAGVPLSKTPPAVLARLVARVATGGFDPIDLVALMQHPLAAFGMDRAAARAAAHALEIGVLRGPRPAPGSAGLRAAFDLARHAADTGAERDTHRRRLGTAGWAAADDLLERIEDALGPVERLAAAPGRGPLAALVEAHVAALRAVAADADGSDARLFEGEAGEELASALAGLLDAARAPDFALSLHGRDYPGLFDALLGDRPVRRRAAGEAGRLHIWGPLEARLQSVDRLILAGLDEGTWPATTRSDPWLSRPMKRQMGLEAPERRIGLAAHDFAQGAAAPEVILSRTARAGGAPTVPSRWLQRLLAVVGAPAAAAMRARGAVHLARARTIDRPDGDRPRPAPRPAPCPPLELRPTRLSVTEIETWIRDPYAIHARHVLRLEPLAALAEEPDAGDRGSLVHEVLKAFVGEWTDEPRAAALARFGRLADEELTEHAAFPEVIALWRPRLDRIGTWFVDAFEGPRAARVAERLLEQPADLEIAVGGAPFLLTGRADRIDRFADGTLAIIDYKTGSVPSRKTVQVLLAPQLPLEAAMVLAGAFGADLAGRPIAELAYVKLTGTGDGGAVVEVTGAAGAGEPPVTAEDLADAALGKLVGLVAQYRKPEQGYPSRPRIRFVRETGGRYDHLARVKEWSAGEGGDGE